MNKKIHNILTAIFFTLVVLTANSVNAAVQTPQITKPVVPQSVLDSTKYLEVNPLDVVASPMRYLNKNIAVKGKFDKFSTLGLDYEPAYRSSEDYITFLILRSDSGAHNIPLSEMKIFLKRTEAEKFIDINAGDEVEFYGKVFSTALGDVWIDASKFTVLNKKDSEIKK